MIVDTEEKQILIAGEKSIGNNNYEQLAQLNS